MMIRSGIGVVFSLLLLTAASPQAAPSPAGHDPDLKKCKRCQAALGKAFAYVKANFKDSKTKRVIGSMMGGYMMAGFAFMMEGNSPNELDDCARWCCQAIKDEGYNRNWYLSMSMFFLAEYAARRGLTPEVQKAFAEGLKMAQGQQEDTGGWCHHREMWKEDGYNTKGGGRDLGMVTTMITGAFVEMKALGVEVPQAMFDRAQKNLESLSDGPGVRYGTDNMVGDAANARASYVLLGLHAAGRTADPWYGKLSKGVQGRYKNIEQGVHGFAPLHYFSVGAAMHRLGSECYRKFADEHLERLIATQTPEGVVPLKGEDDVASTAVFACLVMMQRDGVFIPARRGTRPAAKTGKEELKLAGEAMAKGDLGKAYRHLETISPERDPEDVVAQAREKIKRITEIAQGRFKEAQALEAIGETVDAVKAYQEIVREFPTLPAGQDARGRIDALKNAPKPAKS